MQGLRNMLLQEQKHLQEIADKARMGMSVEPEGHLRISRDKNKPRYYQCIDGNNEIYIPRSNKELPKLLAQRTYNRTVLKKVEARLKQIGKILQDYTANYAQTECQFRYCGTAIPFLTVRSTAR